MSLIPVILLFVILDAFLMLLNGPALIIAAGAAYYAAHLAGHGKNKLTAAVPAVFLVVFSFFIYYVFSLYKKGLFPFAFWTFLASLAAAMAVFYLMEKKEKTSQVIMETPAKQQMPAFVLKIIAAAGLGAAGYFLLDASKYFLSFLFYTACFIRLLHVIDANKSFHTEPPAEADGKPDVLDAGPMPVKDLAVFFSAVSACILVYRAYTGIMNYDVRDPVILTISAVFFAGIFISTGRRLWQPEGTAAGRMNLPEWAALLAVTAAALYLRLKDFNSVPPGIFTDDVYSIFAVDAVLAGRKDVFFSDAVIQTPMLPFWLAAKLSLLLNSKILADRLLRVIFGTANVVLMFFFAREMFGKRVAFLSAAVMSVMFLHLLYSRVTQPWVEVPACAAGAYLFYFMGCRKANPLYFILAGLFTGISLYFYHASKFIPVILAAHFILMYLMGRENRENAVKNTQGFILMTVTALIVFFPFIVYIMKPGSRYFGRISDVNIFKLFPAGISVFKSLAEQIVMATRQLFNGSYFTGLLSVPTRNITDPASAFFLLLGFSAVLASFKQGKSLFILVCFFLGMCGVYLSAPDNAGIVNSRYIAALPVIVLLTALGMDFMVSSLERLLGRPGRIAAPVILAVILAFIAFENLNEYFVVYKNDPVVKKNYSYEFSRMADLAAREKGAKYYLSYFYVSQRAIAVPATMESRGIKKHQYEFLDVPVLELSKLYNPDGRNAVIFAEGLYREFLPIYREYFPNAKFTYDWNYDSGLYTDFKKFKGHYNWVFPDLLKDGFVFHNTIDKTMNFISCEVPYEDIRSLFALDVGYYNEGKLVFSEKAGSWDKIKTSGFQEAKIQGLLEAPETGYYLFYGEGAGSVVLRANNSAGQDGCVYLQKGLNRFSCKLSGFDSSRTFVMYWTGPKILKFEPVPAGRILASDKIFGLDYSIVGEGNRLLYEAREYSVDNRVYWYRDRVPAAVIGGKKQYRRMWKGYIKIKEGAIYTLGLNSYSDCVVEVGGKKVFQKSNGKNTMEKELLLPRGSHQIRIIQDFQTIGLEGKSDFIKLLIKKKGENLPSTVPYHMLSAAR